MSAPTSLAGVYVDELRDLWSANDQMQKVMKDLSGKANDPRLKKTLEEAVSGISKHTEMLKSLVEASGGETKSELCRGMEGLVREAKKHALEESAADSELSDLVLIAQYQRMSHYGLAGFGTAAAYAKALKKSEDETTLKKIVADIYKADEFTSRMAERLEKAAAKAA